MIDVELQAQGAARYVAMQHAVGRESMSGPGSSLEATAEIREWLPWILEKLGAKSMADVPCGDHHWLATVDIPCGYHGYDLLPELVEANRYGFPARRFDVLNAISDVPDGDVILCRDLLVHLSLEHAACVLARFRESGARYLLLTTYPGVKNHELSQSHPGWGWRPLDMEAEPFRLVPTGDGVMEAGAREGSAERWVKVFTWQ
jgi:hypothetical protein